MNTDLDKVYVVTENCVWNYDENSRIIGIALTKDLAIKCFKEYVEETKQDLELDSLDIVEPSSEDDGFIVEEGEDYFKAYKNNDYNTYHTYISLYEKQLFKDKGMEL